MPRAYKNCISNCFTSIITVTFEQDPLEVLVLDFLVRNASYFPWVTLLVAHEWDHAQRCVLILKILQQVQLLPFHNCRPIWSTVLRKAISVQGSLSARTLTGFPNIERCFYLHVSGQGVTEHMAEHKATVTVSNWFGAPSKIQHHCSIQT